MKQALEISNISYSVAGLDILKTLNLELEAQQYYAIAGVNGAGKSTLIKLILDLIRPAPGGEIQIFGADNQDRQCRDSVAYLPEKSGGNVRYQLKTPYRDGTTHVIFEPLDFIARLAALIPRPRTNLTRFHGVFALNGKHIISR